MTLTTIDNRDRAGTFSPELETTGTDDSTCREALVRFPGRIGGLLALANGILLVSDAASGTIWRIDENGSSNRLPIEPEYDRVGSNSMLGFTPAGLDMAPDGTLYVADSTHHRICAVSAGGRMSVIAGGANGYRDGPSQEALFRYPNDVAVTADGACYVADTVNDRIRVISPDGIVTTLAGSIYDFSDGMGPRARFRRPGAVDLDDEGTLYVADTGNDAIRKVFPDGEVQTIAGLPPGGDADGQGSGVGLRWPTGIAVDVVRSLWVADHGNGVVRHLSPTGDSTTQLRLSGLRWPTALALGDDGKLYVGGDALGSGASEGCVMVRDVSTY